MKRIWFGILTWVLVVVAGCAPAFEEVQRLGSQDKALDAVVFKRQTNATVATPTEIYVLPAGGGPSGEPVWRADMVVGLVVSWTSADSVQIEAKEARVFLKRDLALVAVKSSSSNRRVTVIYRIDKSL